MRLTASGLGCSSWPGCEPGELVPRGESTGHSWIEFGNRLITGAVSVSVVLAVLGSRRRIGRPRRDLVLLSWGLVAGVVGQILLGALVVKLHVHPVVVQGHFLLSAVLVANAVVLHHRAGRPDGLDGGPAPTTPLMSTAGLRLARAAVGLGALVMLAGTLVTGAGPHAGDADAERLDVAVRSVAQLHSALTWVFPPGGGGPGAPDAPGDGGDGRHRAGVAAAGRRGPAGRAGLPPVLHRGARAPRRPARAGVHAHVGPRCSGCCSRWPRPLPVSPPVPTGVGAGSPRAPQPAT